MHIFKKWKASYIISQTILPSPHYAYLDIFYVLYTQCMMHHVWFLQYKSQWCFPEWEKLEKKKKSKCTCAHFKIAALSSCPIIHFKNSNINSLLTNQTFLPSLPPNTIKPAIKATMLWVITEEKIFWKKQLFHFLNILNSKLLSDLHFYVNLVHTYAAKILHCWQQ